jgi:DNA polymerase III delta prime subunit
VLAAWLVVDAGDIPLNPRLVGRPGVGKTTLAYAAARELQASVWLYQATMDTRPEDLLVTPVVGPDGSIRYSGSAEKLDEALTSMSGSFLLAIAILYLLMSAHEGFCVPLLESMHFGVPVVAYAAAAVPGTLGGAMWQNLHFLSPAPARERMVFLEEVVESAEILSEEGRLREVDRGYFSFGYDYSILHDRADVVLSVVFRLLSHPISEMKRVMEENLQWRAERHPDLTLLPSAGSIFKKVEGQGAGRLIDECGLKGRTHGGAQIFQNHANIIVNMGGASASDVRALMDLARETVLKETGLSLDPEITLVGEFSP